MRTAVVIVLACLLAAAVAEISNAAQQFADFEKKFDKHYGSIAERAARFQIFKNNLDKAAKLNIQNGSPAFGVTMFMDLTSEEFRSTHLMPTIDLEDLPEAPFVEIEQPATSIPDTWDWTTHNPPVVTPIKNQGQCGSCWAFSATEQVESVWALAGKSLVALGPQQIVDCDKTCEGCNGGFTQYAFEYLIQCGGQESETNYPYTGVNGKCNFNSAEIAASISAWKYVSKQAGDENSTMLPFVYNTAPISVCVDASTWQYYTSGVLKVCGDSIDHCVQITGYTTMDDLPAWIVRNSWGASWGVNGFIYVERNKNLCGIATVATTVTAKTSN